VQKSRDAQAIKAPTDNNDVVPLHSYYNYVT
jgi:hypothetical protein